MARNYGKATRRYAVGGIVPKEADDDEPPIRLDRRPGGMELEQMRPEVLEQGPVTDDPEDKSYVDPDWREHVPEDT